MKKYARTLRDDLKNLKPGMSLELPTDAFAARALAVDFIKAQAKLTKRTYHWELAGRELRVTRGWDPSFKSRYGIDKIEVGQSCLLEVPRSAHRAIRVAASLAGRDYGRNFACHAVANGIIVTRGEDHPLSTSESLMVPMRIVDLADYLEPNGSGGAAEPRQGSACRYQLDVLPINSSSLVPLSEEPLIANLRSYCAYHGRKLERQFRVRAEGTWPDGGHRITRIS